MCLYQYQQNQDNLVFYLILILLLFFKLSILKK